MARIRSHTVLKFGGWGGTATAATVRVFGSETKHKSPYCLESGEGFGSYVTEILSRWPLFQNPRPRNLINFSFWQRTVAVEIELAKKERSITGI